MPKRKNKFILDTNIWISFIGGNNLAILADLILSNDLIIYASPHLTNELREVLAYPRIFKRLKQPIDAYIEVHLALVTVFPTKPLYTDSPDVKDNFLFDLALQSKVPRVVTGDKKILAVKDVKGVEFISLAEFKRIALG
jgi:uncharacterized protein